MDGVGQGGIVLIDAHHHLWDLGARRQDWLDGPEMAPVRRTFTAADYHAVAGVDRSVLVQVLADVSETRDFLAVAAADPVIAGVVGWVDLRKPDVADVLATLPGLVGVRHLVQGEADPRWLTRADVRRGLRAVARAGLSYDLLTLPHQLPAAIETARDLPELSFVLDHLSKPPIASGDLEPWATHLRELAALPNVTAKLSGLVTEAGPGWTTAGLRPYAEVALEAFGPDRLMFGSDWPVCLLAASYAQVREAAEELVAGLSPAERDAVFGGTAQRVYRLG
ncbi:L-fuconolactonase [Amycolatopsis thermophila]|uniref:L-fuconolactonase n=1 Tax=Amycolatopsis thermophila TaxID=206084 RepID=A0ABU0F661_9PSEU|nr:amidohydrolase family protein [Amycolatopsis thermophila]MDQ0383086.1 L-fuconolactonase [Amycolatopsis thermophila]